MYPPGSVGQATLQQVHRRASTPPHADNLPTNWNSDASACVRRSPLFARPYAVDIRRTACGRGKWLCWLSQPLTLRPSVAMIRRASFLAQLLIVALLACDTSATPPGADASKRGITAAATYSLRSAVLSPDTSRIAYATDTSYRTISALWV